MGGLTVPLHLDPADYSRETCQARYDLHTRMSALNPNGWRKAPKSGAVSGRITRLAARAFDLDQCSEVS